MDWFVAHSGDLWMVWGALFAVIETVAVMNDDADDTLSEHLRLWFHVKEKKGRTAWLVVSGAFFAWFIPHILIQGFA